LTHRQPTLATMTGPGNTPLEVDKQGGRNISGNQLYEWTGITMWHGSYISPQGVYDKIRYYEGAVNSPGQSIKNYFHNVWLPWVTQPEKRAEIEKLYLGVHEFLPSYRGAAFTEKYVGQDGRHPAVIRKHMPALQKQFDEELRRFL
ncbi:MAG TPA: hypothetical protein VFV08_12265, partial [Puia sp.]|nr:hypothetical protein [Puia sp.]